MNIIGGASTQSRGRRPLPSGAVSARTISTYEARESVEFTFKGSRVETREMLTWVVGQAGLLWAGGPFPYEIAKEIALYRTPGSYGHAEEYRLAGALLPVFDGFLAKRDLGVRFFQNGGDACSSAVRVARSVTGREAIASNGYHGAHLDFAHAGPNAGGVPTAALALHHRFEFGDVAGMKAASFGAACVIIEVPAWDDENAIAAFLATCREQCDALGIPLIFDDVVCGFRVALAGSSERYGVKPDLVVLGKAMCATGGVSALLGEEYIVGQLDSSAFYSTTFGGHPWACGIAEKTVRHLTHYAAGIYGEKGHLQQIGRALKDGLNERGVKVVGQPERSILAFDTEIERRDWCSRMADQNIIIDRPFFPTLAHKPADVTRTLEAAEDIAR